MIRREQHLSLLLHSLTSPQALINFSEIKSGGLKPAASRLLCMLQYYCKPSTTNRVRRMKKNKLQLKKNYLRTGFVKTVSTSINFPATPSLSLFDVVTKQQVTKNSTWRLSDLYFSLLRLRVLSLFAFFFICLLLSLRNIMEKQITASPVQVTAKPILQQKVETQT